MLKSVSLVPAQPVVSITSANNRVRALRGANRWVSGASRCLKGRVRGANRWVSGRVGRFIAVV